MLPARERIWKTRQPGLSDIRTKRTSDEFFKRTIFDESIQVKTVKLLDPPVYPFP